jgi:hypothetical protein
MPNDRGLYTLAEMRMMVYRNVGALRRQVNLATNEETGDPRFDPLISKNDVDLMINTALTLRAVDLFYNATTVLADQEQIDVKANIVEYPLPADLAILRYAKWKDPLVPYTIQPPNDYIPMVEYDQQDQVPVTFLNGAPTYRRQLNNIVLNETPECDNDQGILVYYIKWVQYLIQDNSVIETQFARLLQEVVVIDASIAAATRHRFLDVNELRKDQVQAYSALVQLCRISSSPPSVSMIVDHPVKARPGTRQWARRWR